VTKTCFRLVLVAMAPLLVSCSSPTFEEQIIQNLQEGIASVDGPWRAASRARPETCFLLSSLSHGRPAGRLRVAGP
jgi:hypothetical protein